MVDRIESRRILVPATFGAGTLTFTPLGFPQGVVRSVAIVVPHGVRGAVGVGLGYGQSVIIPNTAGELIYTDGEVVEWPVDGLPVGVQWALVTDPQGWADHIITVRMGVDEIPAPSGPSALPVDVTPVPLAPPDTTDTAPADVLPADLPPEDVTP